jgi:hypothetical protein
MIATALKCPGLNISNASKHSPGKQLRVHSSEINPSVLVREIAAVCSQNRKKSTDTFYGQNTLEF